MTNAILVSAFDGGRLLNRLDFYVHQSWLCIHKRSYRRAANRLFRLLGIKVRQIVPAEARNCKENSVSLICDDYVRLWRENDHFVKVATLLRELSEFTILGTREPYRTRSTMCEEAWCRACTSARDIIHRLRYSIESELTGSLLTAFQFGEAVGFGLYVPADMRYMVRKAKAPEADETPMNDVQQTSVPPKPPRLTIRPYRPGQAPVASDFLFKLAHRWSEIAPVKALKEIISAANLSTSHGRIRFHRSLIQRTHEVLMKLSHEQSTSASVADRLVPRDSTPVAAAAGMLPPGWVTVKDAALAVGLSSVTISRAADDNLVQSVGKGKRRRIEPGSARDLSHIF